MTLCLAFGTIFVIVAGFFPPWNFVVVIPRSEGVVKRSAGYAPVFCPPTVRSVEEEELPRIANGIRSKDVLGDPKFFALPESDQVIILSKVDPEFRSLPTDDQRNILKMRARAYESEPTTPVRTVEPTTGWDPRFVSVEINWNALLAEWITLLLSTGGLFLFFQIVKSKSE